MKVALSDQAESDLGEIALFIARHGRTHARSFVRELQPKPQDIGGILAPFLSSHFVSITVSAAAPISRLPDFFAASGMNGLSAPGSYSDRRIMSHRFLDCRL
jgi:hypothetical protein